jgi:hypothetical protein
MSNSTLVSTLLWDFRNILGPGDFCDLTGLRDVDDLTGLRDVDDRRLFERMNVGSDAHSCMLDLPKATELPDVAFVCPFAFDLSGMRLATGVSGAVRVTVLSLSLFRALSLPLAGERLPNIRSYHFPLGNPAVWSPEGSLTDDCLDAAVDAHLGIRDFLVATEIPDDDDASFPVVDHLRGLRDAKSRSDRDVGGGGCVCGRGRERASCCCESSIC